MILHHAYHLYADGNWRTGWLEHVFALSHGLGEKLDTFAVGIVGSPENRANAVSEVLSVPGVRVVVEADSGYEQETLDWIDSFVDDHDGVVLYTHSKGSGYPSPVSVSWRRTMTFDAVVNWKQCVDLLSSGVDTVGTTWHPASPSYGPVPYWAGNFWWASASFLRELPPPSREHRYGAEGWIGLYPHAIKYRALREGTFPCVMHESWTDPLYRG